MISLLILVAAIGFGVWLLLTLVKMPEPFPKVIIGIACFAVFIIVLQALGVVGSLGNIRVR